jgi:hypothetical protein
MPTLNEVWEQALQINANLVTVHDDLTTTNSRLQSLLARADEANDWLEELRNLVDQGFATVTAGMQAMLARQDLALKLQAYQIEQGQTMICALEHISRNTCQLVEQATRQTELQTGMEQSLDQLVHLFSTVHPDAALVLARATEERRRIERCCPPPVRKPACTYEPCPAPGEPPRVEHLPEAPTIKREAKTTKRRR